MSGIDQSKIRNFCIIAHIDHGKSTLADRILEAGREQLRLAPLIRALFCEVNPIPVKTAMARMGLCSDLLRLPLCEMSEENRARLFAAMDACGVSA